MGRLIAAALAAVAVSWAGSAGAATILYTSSGSGVYGFATDVVPPPGGGKYKIEITSSIPTVWDFSSRYDLHWDVFRAPAPQPHSQSITGNSYTLSYSLPEMVGTNLVGYLSLPTTQRDYFDSDQYYESYGIPIGTPLYREEGVENASLVIFGSSPTEAPFDYTVTLTLISSVPEADTWAMMILGFGLVGTVARTNSRREQRRLALR